MKQRRRQRLVSKQGLIAYLKSQQRKERFRQKKAGIQRHQLNIKLKAESEGRLYKSVKRGPFRYKRPTISKPDYPPNIKYLMSVSKVFSNKKFKQNPDNGHLYIPKCFSLIENYQESFDFLKKLFVLLNNDNHAKITLDYKNCDRIDVDASICMDVMLAEFISYIQQCRSLGFQQMYRRSITPINFEKENVKKVLFSIGAYRNIKGFKIDFPDIIDLPVIVIDNSAPNAYAQSEVDLTKIVEYIKSCLLRLGRELTSDAENEFYKVIGEVMSNALEHGTLKHSYSIGFFQETHNEDEHFGIFNFCIFNFGDSIYQTFKSENCLNQTAVAQMTQLSEEYTKKGWFRKSSFEEETLWTLYALQEGVTSKKKKRGNGSIQYLENFFNLKGDLNHDNISKLVIVSGNSRILFDGTYDIKLVEKEGEKRKYKMITFNDSGDISLEPDKNFVTFAPHFFPGTMISARILIKFDNTNEQLNGKQSA